jgi:hypothetical protein
MSAQGALSMDYTRFRKLMRHVTHRQNGNCSAENPRKFPNTALKNSEDGERARVKTPSITMGFCFLGGNISGFEVQSQRAVMPCD